MQPDAPVRKSHRRYLVYGPFCALTVVAWNVIGIGAMARAWPADRLIYLVPPLLVALFLLFNLGAFRLPFSFFGLWERTALPNEQPLYTESGCSGRIGWLNGRGPFFTWSVFPSGLGVQSALGAGYIPWGKVHSARKRWLVGLELRHSSLEVRSPVVLPSAHFVEAVRTALEQSGSRVKVEE